MNGENDPEVLTAIVNALKDLEPEVQRRTIQAVITFLDIQLIPQTNPRSLDVQSTSTGTESSFSQNRDLSAKDFLREKLPKTDVERIACLAYYLTHYKNVQFFKTLDLSLLNTEAAQPKFSSASVAVSNAIRAGFIVPAAKGQNQLSSAGEVFIQALPDREAAKVAVANMRVRKRNKKLGKNIKE